MPSGGKDPRATPDTAHTKVSLSFLHPLQLHSRQSCTQHFSLHDPRIQSRHTFSVGSTQTAWQYLFLSSHRTRSSSSSSCKISRS